MNSPECEQAFRPRIKKHPAHVTLFPYGPFRIMHISSVTSLTGHYEDLDFTNASFLAFVCSLKSQFWMNRVWVEQISRKATQLGVSHLSVKQPSDRPIFHQQDSHYKKGNSNVGLLVGRRLASSNPKHILL